MQKPHPAAYVQQGPHFSTQRKITVWKKSSFRVVNGTLRVSLGYYLSIHRAWEASWAASKVARCASTSRQYSSGGNCAPGGTIRLLLHSLMHMWGRRRSIQANRTAASNSAVQQQQQQQIRAKPEEGQLHTLGVSTCIAVLRGMPSV